MRGQNIQYLSTLPSCIITTGLGGYSIEGTYSFFAPASLVRAWHFFVCFRKVVNADGVLPTCPASAANWFNKGHAMCYRVSSCTACMCWAGTFTWFNQSIDYIYSVLCLVVHSCYTAHWGHWQVPNTKSIIDIPVIFKIQYYFGTLYRNTCNSVNRHFCWP